MEFASLSGIIPWWIHIVDERIRMTKENKLNLLWKCHSLFTERFHKIAEKKPLKPAFSQIFTQSHKQIDITPHFYRLFN